MEEGVGVLTEGERKAGSNEGSRTEWRAECEKSQDREVLMGPSNSTLSPTLQKLARSSFILLFSHIYKLFTVASSRLLFNIQASRLDSDFCVVIVLNSL
jgi:hypothetical protein